MSFWKCCVFFCAGFILLSSGEAIKTRAHGKLPEGAEEELLGVRKRSFSKAQGQRVTGLSQQDEDQQLGAPPEKKKKVTFASSDVVEEQAACREVGTEPHPPEINHSSQGSDERGEPQNPLEVLALAVESVPFEESRPHRFSPEAALDSLREKMRAMKWSAEELGALRRQVQIKAQYLMATRMPTSRRFLEEQIWPALNKNNSVSLTARLFGDILLSLIEAYNEHFFEGQVGETFRQVANVTLVIRPTPSVLSIPVHNPLSYTAGEFKRNLVFDQQRVTEDAISSSQTRFGYFMLCVENALSHLLAHTLQPGEYGPLPQVVNAVGRKVFGHAVYSCSGSTEETMALFQRVLARDTMTFSSVTPSNDLKIPWLQMPLTQIRTMAEFLKARAEAACASLAQI